jgi:hypothetical protein
MKKLILLLIFSGLLAGCGIFKKVSEDVKEEMTAPIDPVTGEVLVDDDTFDYDSLLQSIFKIGTMFFPSLAIWEGGLALVSRRKRRHYYDLLKSIIPTNGKIEIIPAAFSFVRGLGVAHSSEDTKKIFEEVVVTKNK